MVGVKDKTPRDKQSHLVYGVRYPNKNCGQTYVGETQQAIKKCMNQHCKPSPGEQYDSTIFTHLSQYGHSFSDRDVKVLDKEERWHERGVKEAIWERVEKPRLNKPGELRFKLSHTWDRALREIPSRLSADPNTNSGSASVSQGPVVLVASSQ